MSVTEKQLFMLKVKLCLKKFSLKSCYSFFNSKKIQSLSKVFFFCICFQLHVTPSQIRSNGEFVRFSCWQILTPTTHPHSGIHLIQLCIWLLDMRTAESALLGRGRKWRRLTHTTRSVSEEPTMWRTGKVWDKDRTSETWAGLFGRQNRTPL